MASRTDMRFVVISAECMAPMLILVPLGSVTAASRFPVAFLVPVGVRMGASIVSGLANFGMFFKHDGNAAL